jgi:hypothetical protein
MQVETITVRHANKMSLVKEQHGQPVVKDFLVYDNRNVERLVSLISALTGKTFVGSGQPTDVVRTLRAV